jgi:hypothetical protein
MGRKDKPWLTLKDYEKWVQWASQPLSQESPLSMIYNFYFSFNITIISRKLTHRSPKRLEKAIDDRFEYVY